MRSSGGDIRLRRMSARLSVKVANLGLIRYEKALAIQSNTVKNILHSGGANVLYLLEHHPVYTVGIRDKAYTMELENTLKQLNADFFRSNRGGLITFHGPGQLVAYPIINLKQFNLTLKKYICLLEKTAIETAKRFDVIARTTKDIGVWVNNNKLASIGVHASRFVTSHGIAINSNVDLTWFEHIVPCGIEGKGVTSLSKELDRNVTVLETSQAFLNSFSEVFGCHLQSDFEPEY